MVKRYKIRELQHPADLATMNVVFDNAECVLVSDYDALAAELADMTAASQLSQATVATLTAELRDIKSATGAIYSEGDEWREQYLAAQAACEEMRNALEDEQARVAALEADIATQKEILAQYHKLNCSTRETEVKPKCNHSLNQGTTLQRIENMMDCTVCGKTWQEIAAENAERYQSKTKGDV